MGNHVVSKACRITMCKSFKIVVFLGPHTNAILFGPITTMLSIFPYFSPSIAKTAPHNSKVHIYTKVTRRLNTEYGIEDV